jgi:hypothetical protein
MRILVAAIIVAAVLALIEARAEEPQKKALLLDSPISLADQTLPAEKAAELAVPSLPSRPGRIIVLRFRMVAYNIRPGGCNLNAQVELNGLPLGRWTAGGSERLIGRSPSFELVAGHRVFAIFNGSVMSVLFAPDVESGDRMTKDGLGATFTLDVTDLARGVDGNSLTFRNLRKLRTAGQSADLIVRGITIGWLDRRQLPPSPDLVPTRPALQTAVRVGPTRLACGRRGGFSVLGPDGVELIVETAVGMKRDAPSELIAADVPGESSPAEVHVEPFGPSGYATSAIWPGLKLARTVEIRGELVQWKERWTNTGSAIRGVPFRHRVFLKGEPARFWLAGSTDFVALACSAQNPTMFLESKRPAGAGFGLVAQSDWLRLLFWMQAQAGVGEIYSHTLALAPGASIDFSLSIDPVRGGESYWGFINRLRRRWGLNDFCVPRAIFWNFARATGGKNTAENLAKSLAHLGPVMVAMGPWLRSQADCRVVTAGAYPKSSPGKAEPDVEAFLTFRHRAVFQEQFRKEAETLHAAIPGVAVIQTMHPAMEAVYKPAARRWPYVADAILDEHGNFFEDATYSRAWLASYTHQGWGILYFVPRPGSAYLDTLLAAMRDSMDRCRADGIYCDEFSWAFHSRGYSRYDYSRWDGCSADLDDEGRVVRLKSDNAFTTESAQLQIIHEALGRGKFFLANGAAALTSVNRLPVARFAEGGNGVAYMPGVHLSTVPLVLGNFGDQKTRRGVFEAVKTCLGVGCVYSPAAVNLLLQGPDNFVSKLYPITIGELGPGWVAGRQRLATCVSRSFNWPGQPGRVRLFRYDANGDLESRPELLKINSGGRLDAVVPPRGLVIAETVEPPRNE